MIEVFTANTPNGKKVPIALEELGIPYELKTLVLRSAEFRSADYLRINPNCKVPAIRHHDGGDMRASISGIFRYSTLGPKRSKSVTRPRGRGWPDPVGDRCQIGKSRLRSMVPRCVGVRNAHSSA